ncbi:hypothetical protein CLU79DRAFT_728427 [Phycomyces nitens]|nr:hypothetical protein CLU79DRAFT_728427 [Phycomyces nitens]
MELDEPVEEKKPAVESQKQQKPEESIPHPVPQPVELEDSFISAPASWQIPPGALQAKADHANHARLLEPIIKVNHKLERLEERVKEFPDDLEAWNALKTEIQQTGDLVQMREFYEKFLAVFPTSEQRATKLLSSAVISRGLKG